MEIVPISSLSEHVVLRDRLGPHPFQAEEILCDGNAHIHRQTV